MTGLYGLGFRDMGDTSAHHNTEDDELLLDETLNPKPSTLNPNHND